MTKKKTTKKAATPKKATTPKKVTTPKKAVAPKKTNAFKNPIFWIALILGCGLIGGIIAVLSINANKQHEEMAAKYAEVWDAYAKAQNDFGYEFGAILGEMGFTMDEDSIYYLDKNTQIELGKQCTRMLDIYKDIYDNPYAVEDDKIEQKNTSNIKNAIDSLTEYTERINKAKESVDQCKTVAQEKKDKIDAEIARKQAEAEKEAAKKKQQEEAQAAYRKNILNYDKFNNELKEGMSLAAVKDVYGGFDSQCKVSSQSGGWVIYSCSPASYSSSYWSASFTFYNGVLKSKAQYGLK